MARLNPYLNFNGTARAAMEFYREVLGGELAITTFADNGGMGVAEAEQHLVMHAQLESPDGLTLMASDTPSHMGPYSPPAGFAVSVDTDDDATFIDRVWAGLSDGATVTLPLGEAPWGGTFGMLTDRFGIDWLLSVNPPR